MVPTLHLRLLGEFRLTFDHAPLMGLDAPHLRSLLAYLALHRSTSHTRFSLASLLWPDMAQNQALARLRSLLRRLYRELPHAKHFLHINRRGIQWNPHVSYASDVQAFEQAFTLVPHAEGLAAKRQALTMVVKLYHGDLLPSYDYKWIQAERDRLRQMYREAMTQLIRLLEQERDPATFDEIHQLYLQLGQTCELCDDRQANAAYEAMLAFARAVSVPSMECAALNRLAVLAVWKFYDLDTAILLLRNVLKVTKRSADIASLVEYEWSSAQICFSTFDTQKALEHAERALDLARACGRIELIARSLDTLAYANMLVLQWKNTADLAAEAYTLYIRLNNQAKAVDCLNLLARAYIMIGKPQDGIEAARLAYKMALEQDHSWGQALSCVQLAFGLWDVGAYSEALSVARQGAILALAQNFLSLLILNLFVVGMVQGTLFAKDVAYQTLLEASSLNQQVGSQIFSQMIAAIQCLCYAQIEAWPEAYTHALQAIQKRDCQLSYLWQFTFCHEIEALLHGGDIERAKEECWRFGKLVGKNQRFQVTYLRTLATLEAWKGKVEQAITYLQSAVKLAEEIGLPGERWQIEAALGDLYQQRCDEQLAQQAFACATAIVQNIAKAIQDKPLQKIFLSSTKVRRLLELA